MSANEKQEHLSVQQLISKFENPENKHKNTNRNFKFNNRRNTRRSNSKIRRSKSYDVTVETNNSDETKETKKNLKVYRSNSVVKQNICENDLKKPIERESDERKSANIDFKMRNDIEDAKKISDLDWRFKNKDWWNKSVFKSEITDWFGQIVDENLRENLLQTYNTKLIELYVSSAYNYTLIQQFENGLNNRKSTGIKK